MSDHGGELDEHGLRHSTVFLCSSSPRRCATAVWLHCPACGWSGVQPEPGETLDLFAEPEHVAGDAECQRRQSDPAYRRRRDSERLVAAGLPPLRVPGDTSGP